jgi:hypothetical protein
MTAVEFEVQSSKLRNSTKGGRGDTLSAMSTILDIPEVRQRVSRLSVEEYHRLPEFNERGRRTELIRGIVVEKISKSPPHMSLAKWLYDRILGLRPSGCVVRQEGPLTLADSEPDRTFQSFSETKTTFVTPIPRPQSWSSKWRYPAARWIGRMHHSTQRPV